MLSSTLTKLFSVILALSLQVSLVLLAPRDGNVDTCKGLRAISEDSFELQYDIKCRPVYLETHTRIIRGKVPSAEIVNSFDPATAFRLHSQPNAPAVIYLDFDGHVWEESSWWIDAYGVSKGKYSEGYSIDNDSGWFTEIERQNIYQIWTMVAEDFAMFDVDVTTELPTGESEKVFSKLGSHALILQDNAMQEACGCGGVAHLDVFSTPTPSNRPALNFSRFGTTVVHPIDIAEIISHEVGHNLGLAHDGTTTDVEYYAGHAMWTPIMGGGRGRGISTWSYGGYPFAKTRWEQRAGNDDFAQIGLYLNVLPDDFGDTLETSTTLTQAEAMAGISGRITTPSDVDVLKLVVEKADAGLYSIALEPTQYGPNLDPELKVLDANGLQRAISNPEVFTPTSMTYITSGLNAKLSLDLIPGTYFIRIDGVGQGSIADATGYDDYGSLGTYTLAIAVKKLAPTISEITPSKFVLGKRIIIRGTNLDSVKVYLGAKLLKQISSSANKLVVLAPASAKQKTFTLRIVGKYVQIKKQIKKKS